MLKLILGAFVTALVLFIFGFVYWALNPLPYQTLNAVGDPAAVQAEAARLFPEDGLYLIPGPGNDETALELLDTGPAAMITIDHSPAAGADPSALILGIVHNLVTALLLVLLLRHKRPLGEQLRLAALTAVIAIAIINGSEMVWWMQPLSWLIHQAIYYLLYFLIAAATLNFFLPSEHTT